MKVQIKIACLQLSFMVCFLSLSQDSTSFALIEELDSNLLKSNYKEAYIDTLKYFENEFTVIRYHNDHLELSPRYIASFRYIEDTIVINDRIYKMKNLYPNIYFTTNYMPKSNESLSGFAILLGGIPYISFYESGRFESACMFNNQYGTVVFYWDKDGNIESKGAFYENKKNGLWIYYDSKGNITKQLMYNLGIVEE